MGDAIDRLAQWMRSLWDEPCQMDSDTPIAEPSEFELPVKNLVIIEDDTGEQACGQGENDG